jgi:enhancing lycopene biosynthesis protein 2
VTGKHGEKVKIDQAISDADPKEFDALLIPGGFSPDLLRGDVFADAAESRDIFSFKKVGINQQLRAVADRENGIFCAEMTARVNSLKHSWKIRNPFSRSATARSC